MKVVLYVHQAAHQREHMQWMREGLERCGVGSIEAAEYNDPRPADVAVVWGWKQDQVINHCAARHTPLLVMERGHLQPRLQWTSLGWGGLGNRGKYIAVMDDGERFSMHWGKCLKRWAPAGAGYGLVCGQCPGDAAIGGLNVERWAQTITDLLLRRGIPVVYRPHPAMAQFGDRFYPAGAQLSTNDLDHDLAGAEFAVTYNSTVGVECVLAGVPTVTRDEGSMAWPVSSHSLDEPLARPSRHDWAAKLAWCQFNENEIRSGFAWDTVRQAI